VSWERRRYALWAPIYDFVVAPLRRARASSIGMLELRAGEKVLVAGAGTGEDMPYLPAGVQVFAVDLTPAMLARARRRPRPPEHLAVMDAEALAVPSGAFDAVVLHLILAVVGDPGRCFAEAARAVRPGGRIAVFDKFVRAGEEPSPFRRLLNLVTRPLATDITRRLDDVVRDSGAAVTRVREQDALGGRYAIVLFRT
jgi:phosphatidylethanolamine/phosphatidyl-N-methylethanolamine N-methyltransferase